jgi:hypothetical protein
MVILTAPLSAGCAIQPYVPSTHDALWGYASAPVRPDCLEIGYVGPPRYTSAQTHYYAALRAAELTIQAGKPAFQILLSSDSKGRRLVDVPPTYETITSTDANGDTTTTTIETSPGYTATVYYPVNTILIRLLASASAQSIDAIAIVRAAQEKGLPLEARTLAQLTPLAKPSQ